MPATLNIALAQLCASPDMDANLAAVESIIRQAKTQGADYLQLPESWLAMGLPVAEQLVRVPEALALVQRIAKELQLYVHAGTLPMADSRDHRPYASSLLVDPQGQLVGRYDKIHLFDALVGDRLGRYQESDSYHPGQLDQGLQSWSINDWCFAPAVCYDLRFPELARAYRALGAQVLCYPSAFTYRTGEAHWLALLQARAIENGCFVIAANQTGWHDQQRRTWGHSVVLDPWGRVLAMADEQPQLVLAQLQALVLEEVREQIPSWQHRRL